MLIALYQLQEIEDQYKSGYEFSTHTLHFMPDRWGEGVLQIIIDRDEAESDGWNVTLESHYEVSLEKLQSIGNISNDINEIMELK